ncbi:hypothetical protein QM480_24630 [Flectobacillus sp. DC10W]|uniref:Nucleotidyltransferase n=1 Tax=Flectobacillus longus TaxID=2984207 RepID=A0ABT6YVE0_9BACT|nr:hypothetical protein [Flectobacillus longus]MDI9867554.1 hypothetical protein [Flectobacillus longus]
MSVQTHLSTTSSRLILTSDEDISIYNSISTLQTRLKDWFGNAVVSHFMFGSYTRNTILPRNIDTNSDIDYMLVFDNSDSKKPQAFLDRIKKFVDAKYSTSEVYQSYPTIVLKLNHIKFELVPAYKYSVWYDSFKIPSKVTYDNWIDTDPSKLKIELTNKNTDTKSLIKPLVRLLKYWNVRENKIYSSYEIERFVIDNIFVQTSSIKTIFFEAIDDLYAKRWSLPEYKRLKVEKAKDIVDKTRKYEYDGMPYKAEEEIKKLIPVYGE